MLAITPHCSIDEKELHLDFVRSPGPGGQNVNKLSTGVQLRFDVRNSPSLPAEVKARLAHLAGRRLTLAGELLITAHRFRTQERNRDDAVERLSALIRKSFEKPKRRIKTAPTIGAGRRRVETKKRHAERKRERRFLEHE
jgi:ribosome-associated protein